MKKRILIIGSALMLSFATIAQVKVFTGGKVSIGNTTNPSTFSVDHLFTSSKFAFANTATTITSSALIRGNNGYSSAITPDFTYYGDDSTGFFHPADNIIGFALSGSEKARFHSNGNFGFTTTTPPARVTIYSGKTNSTGLSIKNWDVDLILTEDSATNSGKIQVMSGGSESTIGNTPYNLLLQPQGGKIAIGTTSPVNDYLLTLKTSSSSGYMKNGINMNLVGGTGYGIFISSNSSNYKGLYVENTSGSSSFYNIGTKLTTGTAAEGYLCYRSASKTFGVYGKGGTYSGYFNGKTVVTNSTSPNSTADFEVQNTTAGTGYPATISLRQTNSLTTSGSILANLNFGDNYTTNAQANIQVTRDAASSGSGDLPTAIKFYTTADGSSTLTERMKIDNAGNVAIGANTQSGVKFYIYGGKNKFYNTNQSYTPELNFELYALDPRIYSPTNNIAFYNTQNSDYCDIEIRTLYEYSDINAKTNIENLSSSLSKILQLRGVSYNWISDAKLNAGFIAQEVEQVIPELVIGNDSNQVKLLSYSGIIPYLVEAIKEQELKIVNLENELTNCCTKNTDKSYNPNNNTGSNTGINIEKSNSSYLLQNRPNPFSRETIIDYFIASDVTNASIMLFDLNGKLLKTIAVNTNGKGSVTVSNNELIPGMYIYSLVINGNEADTKKMILSN